MFHYSGDTLYSLITSNSEDVEKKISILTELKAHIKREFVELTEVPKYFESLKAANKSSDFKLSSIAFSTVCHLIKRVGMQDPHILRGNFKVTLPILFNRLLDQKPNFRSQAKSSLETFWLATPTIVESYLKDSALIHSNQFIRSESIIFISDLIDLSKNFNFPQFLPSLINLLKDDSIEVLKNTEVLLIKYYTLNKGKIQDLVTELKNQKIDQKTAVKVLKEIDLVTANLYALEARPQGTNSRSTIDSFNNLTRARGTRPAIANQTREKPITTSKELANILEKITSAKLDPSIQPKLISSAQELSREVESLLPPFNGKETEFNWANREKSINKFRSIVAGNSEKYPDALVQSTRALTEGISKSVSSLRTTLSSSGCQLIKELAAHLGKHLDPIAEQMFHPLASMTSATKRITSMNVFGSLCVLLVNTSYSNRLFNQSCTLYQDKNVQPRLYSSTFLQIFILKHGAKFDQHNLESIQKWVFKGVADPNITVRESMRTTFWILYRRFPQVATTIFSKQDMNMKKALERSKPKDITESLSSTSTRPVAATNERTRPSIREFVASKQRERRSISDSSTLSTHSREPSEQPQEPSGDIGKPSRIGGPQRVRAPSSGNSYMLPRQLSRGARSSSLNSLLKTETKELDKFSEITSIMKADGQHCLTDDEGINEMKKNLGSALTREKIQGIHSLKEYLNDGAKIHGISSTLSRLIILDSFLLKPLLKIQGFYDLVDVTSLVKVLAVNKEEMSILLQKFKKEEIIKGINAVIKSLESLHFDNAPSTMFHIKHKSSFLDFSVIHLYEIVSSEDFKITDELLQEIYEAIFPLSISDYPRYDELVVQLYELNEVLFEKTLANCSAYIKSKIHMILKDFKETNHEEKHEATEYGLAEMTMINPLNKKPSDPTTSIQAGFGTDMTMILPTFKVPSQKENIDEDAKMGDPNDKEGDYMSDIFNNKSHKDTDQAEQMIKRESIVPIQENENEIENHDSSPPTQEVDMEIEEGIDNNNNQDEDGDVVIISEPNVVSPFFDNPDKDDVIDSIVRQDNLPHLKPVDLNGDQDSDDGDQIIHTDEMTKNLTDKISGIHISPQKPNFTSTNESISILVDRTDPFFCHMKKHIKIFDDKKPSVEIQELNLTDLEISHIGTMSQSEKDGKQDELISAISNSTEKFNKDQIDTEEMNKVIKNLHLVLSKEDVLSWMKSTGFKPMLLSTINYYNTSSNITKQLCFKGMIVFKELMILNSLINNMISLTEAVAVWNILVMIVENLKDFKNELYISADELVDEILDLNVVNLKSTIRKSCFSLLKEGESNSTPLVSFLLLALIKCIEHECLSLDQIKKIDEVIYKYLSSGEVEIRRLTIITYSKCKNKLELIDTNANQKSRNGKIKHEAGNIKESDSTTDFFGKLSVSQRKLVDYYCNI